MNEMLHSAAGCFYIGAPAALLSESIMGIFKTNVAYQVIPDGVFIDNAKTRRTPSCFSIIAFTSEGTLWVMAPAELVDGEVSEEALATFEQRVDELMLELSDFAADVRNFANEVGVVKTEEGNHE
jgi:hypothetical protein